MSANALAIAMPGALASALATAAEALVGTPFRLHGRDPATGLDCIGLLAAALAAIGRQPTLPAAYALRTGMPADLARIAHGCGLVAAPMPIRRGDVIFVRVCATQHHLLIAAGERRFVHAHAGLRRVVVLDAALPWPPVASWRLQTKGE